MVRFSLALICTAGLLSALPAAAQEFNQVQVIIDPRIDLDWTRTIRKQVRKAADRHVNSPFEIDESRFGADLAPLDVSNPDATAPQSSTGGNFWFEGGGGHIENAEPAREYDVHKQSYSVGFDVRANERLILGAIGNHATTDINNLFLPGNTATHAWAGGGYLAYFLSDTVILTSSLLYKQTENESESTGVLAEYDSHSWHGTAEVISYHFVNGWTLKPAVGLSYSHEVDEAYVDSGATAFPQTTTETGAVSAGATAVYTFTLANGMELEPYVGFSGEWVFLNNTIPTSTFVEDDRDFDIILTAGTDLTLSDALSFSMEGEIAGLAQPQYRSFEISGRLTFRF